MAWISFVQNVLLEQRQFSGVMEEEGNDRWHWLSDCHFIRASSIYDRRFLFRSVLEIRGYALAGLEQLEAE